MESSIKNYQANCKNYGQGTVYRINNGNYRAQVFIDGKRVGKTFHSKADAIYWKRMRKGQTENNVDAMTVSLFLEEWQTLLLSKRPKTLYQYQHTIDLHIKPGIGETLLTEISFRTMDKFFIRLQESGIGNRTIHLIHSILHNAFETAVKYRYIHENPAKGIKLPPYAHTEMKFLTPDEVNLFLQEASNTPDYSLFFLAVTTGMRMGELFGLKWSDIDLQERYLQVKRQIQYVPRSGKKFTALKTLSSRRTIELSDGAISAFSKELKKQKLQKEIAGSKWVDNDLVFPNTIGNPRDASQTRSSLNSIIKKSGVKQIRFHDLRHTAASLLLNANVPLSKVSQLLGHSTMITTARVYYHFIRDKSREISKVMDVMIPGNNVK